MDPDNQQQQQGVGGSASNRIRVDMGRLSEKLAVPESAVSNKLRETAAQYTAASTPQRKSSLLGPRASTLEGCRSGGGGADGEQQSPYFIPIERQYSDNGGGAGDFGSSSQSLGSLQPSSVSLQRGAASSSNNPTALSGGIVNSAVSLRSDPNAEQRPLIPSTSPQRATRRFSRLDDDGDKKQQPDGGPSAGLLGLPRSSTPQARRGEMAGRSRKTEESPKTRFTLAQTEEGMFMVVNSSTPQRRRISRTNNNVVASDSVLYNDHRMRGPASADEAKRRTPASFSGLENAPSCSAQPSSAGEDMRTQHDDGGGEAQKEEDCAITPSRRKKIGDFAAFLTGKGEAVKTKRKRSNSDLPENDQVVVGVNANDQENGDDDDEQPHNKEEKHVHFPDDVIKSVAIVHTRDNNLLMQVEYNRPMWTYAVAFFSYVALVLSCALIASASYPANLPGQSTSKSIAAISFAVFAFTAIIMGGFCYLTFRPTRFERRMLRYRQVQVKLAVVALSGSLAQVLLMVSLMLVITAVNGVVYVVAPLVMVYLYEVGRRRIVSILDSVGGAVVCIGIGALIVGEVRRQDQVAPETRVVAIVCSIIAGLLESTFRHNQKMIRRYVSNSLILVLTTVAAALFLLAIGLAVGAFEAPLGDNPQDKGLVHLDGMEFEKVIGAGILTCVSWGMQHSVSVYFDTISIVAGHSLCGPLMLLIFNSMDLPSMSIPFQLAGGLTILVGCSTVLLAGWNHRKRVELAFSLFDFIDDSTPEAGDQLDDTEYSTSSGSSTASAGSRDGHHHYHPEREAYTPNYHPQH